MTSGHFPVELLDDLDADGLLALDAQRVHRVGQVKRRVLGDLLHQLHAAVEVGVQVEHQRAVGNRLDQLRASEILPRGSSTMDGMPAAAQ